LGFIEANCVPGDFVEFNNKMKRFVRALERFLEKFLTVPVKEMSKIWILI